jgi:Lsr2
MAKKTIYVDDLDGSEIDVATHRFSIDGDAYEIDLSQRNLDDLYSVLEPFMSAGRAVRGSRRKRLSVVPASKDRAASEFSREQRVAIREWAREHGYDVAERGAFSKEVLAAYREANGDAMIGP